jgi:two-component system chemotaxis response regulator CheY
MKTLIVDDDFTCRAILHRMLKPFGETRSAVNGVEAIKEIKIANRMEEPYDLICLDIMLPEKSGLTVLSEIRAIESGKHAPGKIARIIMITALGDKENVLAASQSCDAYLVKPVNKHKLMAHLKKFGFVK